MNKLTLEMLLNDAEEANKEFKEAMKVLSFEEFNLTVLPESIKRKVEEFACGRATIVQIAQLIHQFPFIYQPEFMRKAMDYLCEYLTGE